MKTLLLTASALTLIAAPAHAQLLGGGGQAGVTGSLNGTINSTVRAPTETVRSTTRGTLRSDAATRGSQNVDRENGSVAIDRSADTDHRSRAYCAEHGLGCNLPRSGDELPANVELR